MNEILLYILQNITTNPDDVSIEEKDEEGVKHLIITTHPDDVGRVIGREGKIIKAIRSIMRVVAIQQNQRVRISIVSENDNHQTEQQESTDDQTQEESTPKTTATEPEPNPSPTPETQDLPQEDSPEEKTLDLEI